jgi:catechol 2,3-dioxygenase-like lactoylglutathione lyase family enzyme
LLGTFLEISIATPDIRASVEFYEALGFSHCRTGDTWPHPYGVLTDGRIHLGLHHYRFPSPSITCVRAGVAAAASEFTGRGIELAFAKTGDDSFNEIGFRDPAGQMVTVLEARTFFPTERRLQDRSLCGWFEAFSLPAANFAPVRDFWEGFGFIALDEADTPWLRQSLTSSALNLALHRPRTLDRPMLVFSAADAPERIARLRDLGIALSPDLPRGLDPGTSALLDSPEGTALLLIAEELD